MAQRKTSADHEETWLILAGFFLRPGFGAAGDDLRIDSLWRLHDHGLYFLGKRSKCQEYILWRRVAGGLARQRQEQILAPELEKIRTRQRVLPELIRLAGSLERLPNETKTELANLFIDTAKDLAREKKHCAPYLAALGHILNRAPLYAGPETVVSPDLVERAYETFRPFDWGAPELAEMPTLFLRAARVVGNRSFDLPKALRHRIAAKLENVGVAPQKTGKLKEFVPLGGSERITLHDERCPGLILTGASRCRLRQGFGRSTRNCRWHVPSGSDTRSEVKRQIRWTRNYRSRQHGAFHPTPFNTCQRSPLTPRSLFDFRPRRSVPLVSTS